MPGSLSDLVSRSEKCGGGGQFFAGFKRSVALRWTLAVLLVVAATAATVAIAGETDASALERRVKAAFLYKFAGYVEWPPSAFIRSEEPLVIGVVGDDAVADELAQVIAGRSAGNRPLTLRRLSRFDPAERVHVLFVGRGVERTQAAALLARTQDQPVLTVTEADNGLPTGSVINFVILDNKVRFEISAATAARNGLRLGSQLQAVAWRR